MMKNNIYRNKKMLLNVDCVNVISLMDGKDNVAWFVL